MRLLPSPSAVRDRVCRHPVVAGLVIGVLLLVGVVAWVLDRNARARGHRREAEAALAVYEFERARDELRAYLDVYSDDAEAQFWLAQACRRARVEEFAQARTQLDAAARWGWPKSAVTRERALLAFQSQEGGARSEPPTRLLADPTAERALVMEALARGCIRAARLDDAQAWLDRWVAAEPNDWYARLWRGALLHYMDQPFKAVADYEYVLQVKPDRAEARRGLGLTLVECGFDYPRALRLLEDYDHGHPNDPDVQVGVARCRQVLGEPAARDLLQEVVATHPDHPDALLALALDAADRRDYADALNWLRRLEPWSTAPPDEESLERLLRLEPTASSGSTPTRLMTVYHLTGNAFRQAGRDGDAESFERRLRQLESDVDELRAAQSEHARNPGDVAVWRRLADLYPRVGMRIDGQYWQFRVQQATRRGPKQ